MTRSISSKVKQLFLEFDLYAHVEFLRFKNEDSYRTKLGASVSLIQITLFMWLLFSLLSATLQKQTIISSSTACKQTDPAHAELIASPDKNFMFAVGLTGIDLTSSKRYFDIELKSIAKINGVWSATQTPLVPCSIDHWAGVNQDITNKYHSLNLNQWLCPPINTSIPLAGKYTSDTFKFADIIVKKCNQNNPYYPGTTCYNESQIEEFIRQEQCFTLSFYYLNALIRESQEQYLQYYFEDTNYIDFNIGSSVATNLFFNSYSIETQQSISPSPLHDIPINEQGLITSEQMTNLQHIPVIYPKEGQGYVFFHLRKSPTRLHYVRSFQLLDSTLSYIGGLFSIVTAALSIIKLYSRYCFQLEFGDSIFTQNNGGCFGSADFNFVTFMLFLPYVLLSKFFSCPSAAVNMKRFQECREECVRQLSLEFLFQKLYTFSYAIENMFQKYQHAMLYFIRKPTLKIMQQERRLFGLRKKVYRIIEQRSGEVHVDSHQREETLLRYFNQFPEYSRQQQLNIDIRRIEQIHDGQQGYYQHVNSSQVQLNPGSFAGLQRRGLSHLNERLIEGLGVSIPQRIYQRIQTYERSQGANLQQEATVRSFRIEEERPEQIE